MAIVNMIAAQKLQAQSYVNRSLRNLPLEEQFQMDCHMWLGHINHPNNAAAGELVKRIFFTLGVGGLQYRPSTKVTAWRWFGSEPWPAAAALSHGGRVLIQLPMANVDNPGYQDATDHDNTFWRWVTAQDRGGGMLLASRIATHGVSTLPHAAQLAGGIPKHMKEVKAHGPFKPVRQAKLALGPTKFSWMGLRDPRTVQAYHRHWGVDLALGGMVGPAGGRSQRMTGIGYVEGDGSDGHMYLYHMAPTSRSYGGILIGVEGSKPGAYDQFGHYHGPKADSGDVSPTGGLKWRILGRGPVDAEDDLFVDLSRPSNRAGKTVMNDAIDLYQYTPQCVTHPPRTCPVGPNPAGVTFIPTLETFKKWTSETGKIRSKSPITTVDGALQTYLGGSPYPNPQIRYAALSLVILAANSYVTQHPDDPRTKGVKKLLQCIRAEATR